MCKFQHATIFLSNSKSSNAVLMGTEPLSENFGADLSDVDINNTEATSKRPGINQLGGAGTSTLHMTVRNNHGIIIERKQAKNKEGIAL